MRNLFLFCMTLLSFNAFSQCNFLFNTNNYSNTIVCGDSIHLSAFPNLYNDTIIYEDFNYFSYSSDITVLDGSPNYNNPCGSSLDGSPSLWIGGNMSPYLREIKTIPVDVSNGGSICFDFDFAGDENFSDCEDPDQPNEGIFLQYSINGGTNWITFHYFEPTIYIASALYNWSNYCFSIPSAAQTNNTSFRLIQSVVSGNTYDHWGIDNLLIANSPSTYYYDWFIDGTSDNIDTSLYLPVGSHNIPVVYTNGIDSCYDTVNVVVNDHVINPIADTAACQNFVFPPINGSFLSGNQAYYTGPNATGTKYEIGDVISTYGNHTFYAYDTTSTSLCPSQESFSLTINTIPYIPPPTLSGSVCSPYSLPAISGANLSGNESYYTESMKGGTQFNIGDPYYFSGVDTLYLYDETLGSSPCYTQDTLILNFIPTPELNSVNDTNVCEYFVLPTISGTNLTGNEMYYLNSNASGQAYDIGDTLFSTGINTVYIYDSLSNGFCNDEVQFTVQINNNVDTSVVFNNATLTANASGIFYSWLDCDGDTLLSNQNGQVFTPPHLGSFALIATDNDQVCIDTSSCYTFNTSLMLIQNYDTTQCNNNVFSVDYTSNVTYNAGNNFTVQISDANGNFSQPTNIGSIQSNNNNGSINVNLGSQVFSAGNGYQLQIVSSNPPVNGSVSNSTMQIYAPTDTSVSVTNSTITVLVPNQQYSWLNCDNNTIVPNESGQIFQATSNGNYAAIVTDNNNCSDTSACYYLKAAGVSIEENLKDQIKIYPNPAQNRINIEANFVINSVELVNVFGQSVFQGNTSTITVEQFANGVYFLKVYAQDKVYTEKVILE